VLLLVAGGVLCLAVFVVVELSAREPILDLRLFGGWVFSLSAVLSGLLSVGLFAGAFYTPLFLQQGQGLGAFEAGLTLLPAALVTTVMMPLSGRLYDRFGARWLGAVGFLLLAVGTYMMHVITPEISRTPIIVANCIRNGGIGLALIPVITGATAGLPTARTGQASAILNVVQRMASALALAALTALLTGHEAQQSLSQASLLPTVAPGFPQLTAIAGHGQGAILGLDGTVQNQAFGGSLDDVFLLTAGLSAIGVLLALLLPTGSSLARARKVAASTGSEPAGGSGTPADRQRRAPRRDGEQPAGRLHPPQPAALTAQRRRRSGARSGQRLGGQRGLVARSSRAASTSAGSSAAAPPRGTKASVLPGLGLGTSGNVPHISTTSRQPRSGAHLHVP
jgi:hypothetical protein